jgi:hypothetical protein
LCCGSSNDLWKKNEPALVSAVGGTGSAMLFRVAPSDLTRAGRDRIYNHIYRIGSQ